MSNKTVIQFIHAVRQHGLMAYMPADLQLEEGIAMQMMLDVTKDKDKIVACLRNFCDVLDETPVQEWLDRLSDNESSIIFDGAEYYHFKDEEDKPDAT